MEDQTTVELRNQIAELKQSVETLRGQVSGARVRFQNFEGLFKTFTTAAPTANDFPNGSIILSDISGTRKINVVINGVVYSVTVT